MTPYIALALLLMACSTDDGATDAPPVTAGTGGSAGAQSGSGCAAGQAGVSGLGGTAGSAQGAGSGGLAGSGGEAAGQGGGAGDAGSGGAPVAGAAGEAGAGGEAGGAGAPVCVEGPSALSLCSSCDGSWPVQGSETPVVFDAQGKQVILRYCEDKPCAVYVKKFSDGSLGNKQTDAECNTQVNILRAAMYGSVDAMYLDHGQVLRMTLRAGYQPDCAGILEPVDFSLPVPLVGQFGGAIGCEPRPEATVGCPSFPEESVKVCTECLTDSCSLVPVGAVRETLFAHLGNELRRQVAALVSGSCDAASVASPAGDACVSPIK